MDNDNDMPATGAAASPPAPPAAAPATTIDASITEPSAKEVAVRSAVNGWLETLHGTALSRVTEAWNVVYENAPDLIKRIMAAVA